jgi:hypothetical protein
MVAGGAAMGSQTANCDVLAEVCHRLLVGDQMGAAETIAGE